MKALVVGLGKSGVSAAQLLLRRGFEVRVYDRSPNVEVPTGTVAFVGDAEPPAPAFADVDLVVLSPGVPPVRPRELAGLLAPHATITGELELALLSIDTSAPRVLVTGTNGKSTVTALTGELLRAGGRNPFVGGNLGTPLCALLVEVIDGRATPPDALVIECSSFQLETLSSAIRREVGMVLNITPDHLDRYENFETYAASKQRLIEMSTGMTIDLTRCPAQAGVQGSAQALLKQRPGSRPSPGNGGGRP